MESRLNNIKEMFGKILINLQGIELHICALTAAVVAALVRKLCPK